jgi:hypothetical protein
VTRPEPSFPAPNSFGQDRVAAQHRMGTTTSFIIHYLDWEAARGFRGPVFVTGISGQVHGPHTSHRRFRPASESPTIRSKPQTMSGIPGYPFQYEELLSVTVMLNVPANDGCGSISQPCEWKDIPQPAES